MIQRKGGAAPEKPGAKPEEAIPLLRDVLETHRLEVDNGAAADDLADWVKAGAARLRLEEVRLPGIQRTAELRAGQGRGARSSPTTKRA